MREKTRKRLLALLEGEKAKLRAKQNADHWSVYRKTEAALNELVKSFYAAKSDKVRREIMAKTSVVQQERDAAWKLIQEQTKKMILWVEEEVSLEYDIADLQQALSTVRMRTPFTLKG